MQQQDTTEQLSAQDKAEIDAKSYYDLLYKVRFAAPGQFPTGAKGTYWLQRMNELRAAPGGNEEHVACSKSMGW